MRSPICLTAITRSTDSRRAKNSASVKIGARRRPASRPSRRRIFLASSRVEPRIELASSFFALVRVARTLTTVLGGSSGDGSTSDSLPRRRRRRLRVVAEFSESSSSSGSSPASPWVSEESALASAPDSDSSERRRRPRPPRRRRRRRASSSDSPATTAPDSLVEPSGAAGASALADLLFARLRTAARGTEAGSAAWNNGAIKAALGALLVGAGVALVASANFLVAFLAAFFTGFSPDVLSGADFEPDVLSGDDFAPDVLSGADFSGAAFLVTFFAAFFAGFSAPVSIVAAGGPAGRLAARRRGAGAVMSSVLSTIGSYSFRGQAPVSRC